MQNRRSAAFLTLGCKVNQYETDAMEELLSAAGYEIVDFKDQADVYVINTCSVTNIADRKSRQMIHRARKMNPDAVIAAAGCYVQAAEQSLTETGIADILIGNNKKKEIVRILDDYFSEHRKISEVIDIAQDRQYEDLSIRQVSGHTRAYVKIQDGCNQFCSYCIIPYARGRIRSKDPDAVMDEIRALAQSGFKEVVLTGIHLSSYGKDLASADPEESAIKNACNESESKDNNTEGPKSVYNESDSRNNNTEESKNAHNVSESGANKTVKLERIQNKHESGKHKMGKSVDDEINLLYIIKRVNAIPGIERIRLGSLEPRIITDQFVRGLTTCEKLCPHFHLSLQSGCDETLRRMNRHYTTKEYEEALAILRKYYDKPALTTDVIAGFVGETEEEFEKTRSFLEKIRLYEMHIFKYSVRVGTRAEKMKGHLPDQIKSDRSAVLLELAQKLKMDYEQQFIGSRQKVLLEEEVTIDGQTYMQGYTDRYLKIAVKFDENNEIMRQNAIVEVKVEGFLDKNLLFGKVSIEF